MEFWFIAIGVVGFVALVSIVLLVRDRRVSTEDDDVEQYVATLREEEVGGFPPIPPPPLPAPEPPPPPEKGRHRATGGRIPREVYDDSIDIVITPHASYAGYYINGD